MCISSKAYCQAFLNLSKLNIMNRSISDYIKVSDDTTQSELGLETDLH